MPIFQVKDRIAVQNDICADNPVIAQEVGQISIELAIYLTTKIMEEETKRRDPSFTGVQAYFKRPTIRALVSRSRLAGKVCYRPPLLDTRAELSSYGYEIGKRVQYLLDALEASNPGITTEIDRWTNIEQAMISMAIPIRSAQLLKSIAKATNQVEIALREELQKDPEMIVPIPDPTQYDRQRKTKPPLTKILSDLDDDDIIAKATPLTELQPIVVPSQKTENNTESNTENNTENELEKPNYDYAAWCPTITFSQTTRNALVQLQKFGLVDTKIWHTAGPGRARHVVRTSRIGELFLKDVAQRGFI